MHERQPCASTTPALVYDGSTNIALAFYLGQTAATILAMAAKDPDGEAALATTPDATTPDVSIGGENSRALHGPDLKALGQRIRATRQANGIGLRELARRIRCSAGLVSQVENGLVSPSVATLYAITTELNVPVDELFHGASDEPSDPLVSHPFAHGQQFNVRAEAAPPASGIGAYALVRSKSGHRAHLPGNVAWRSLAGTNDVIEFLEISYPPGAMSCPPSERLRHDGEERGYVLEGAFELQIGDELLVLTAGDSISFAAEIPHRLTNTTDRMARGIWLVDARHPHGH